MKPSKRVLIVRLAFLALAVSGAVALVDNDINVIATGGSTSIQVDITMDIGGNLPVSRVEWVGDRRSIGVCGPEIRLGSVSPFEVGEHPVHELWPNPCLLRCD